MWKTATGADTTTAMPGEQWRLIDHGTAMGSGCSTDRQTVYRIAPRTGPEQPQRLLNRCVARVETSDLRRDRAKFAGWATGALARTLSRATNRSRFGGVRPRNQHGAMGRGAWKGRHISRPPTAVGVSGGSLALQHHHNLKLFLIEP